MLNVKADIRFAVAPGSDTPGNDWLLLGDEQLEEYHYQSRTAPINDWPVFRHKCTPSVVRFFKQPIEQQGDFRVDVSPKLQAYLRLNGEDEITDPKTRYFFGVRTALFNTTGYPRQAYATMQGNILRGVSVGQWLKFETLTPNGWTTYVDSNGTVQPMTHESHPHLVQRFDLVCWKDKHTHHKPNTPQGIIDYYLLTVEGFAWLPLRYVRKL